MQQINAADDLSRQHFQMHIERFMLKMKINYFLVGIFFYFIFYFIFFLPAFVVCLSVLHCNTDKSAPKNGGLIWVHTVCLYTYIDQ